MLPLTANQPGSPQANLLETADRFAPADRAAGPWQAETALADESGLFVDLLALDGSSVGGDRASGGQPTPRVFAVGAVPLRH